MAAKKAAPKPALLYDKKLVAAWARLGQKGLVSTRVSLEKVIDAPGTFDALADAIAQGKVAHTALWSFAEGALDHVPVSEARATLEALPTAQNGLWYNYARVGGLLLRALVADAMALDGVSPEARLSVHDLVEVAKLHAGILPAGTASPRITSAIVEQWGDSLATLGLVVVGANVTRVSNEEAVREAARVLVERLVGERSTELLARAVRGRLKRHEEAHLVRNLYPLYPNPLTLELAAPMLSLAEIVSFQSSFRSLRYITRDWSAERCLQAAHACEAGKRPDHVRMLASLAMLALDKDPTLAEKAERYVHVLPETDDSVPPVAFLFATLSKTPTAWQRDVLVRQYLGEERVRTGFGAPLVLALLTAIDRDEAEAYATVLGREVDWSRIIGVDPSALLPRVVEAGPMVTRGLLVAVSGGITAEHQPSEAVDARMNFLGALEESWYARYLAAIPEARAFAILQRAVDAGRGANAKAALSSQLGGASLWAAFEAQSLRA